MKTYGGLTLVKLNLKNRELPEFKAVIHVDYKTSGGEIKHDLYDVHYQSPVNEQFYSD